MPFSRNFKIPTTSSPPSITTLNSDPVAPRLQPDQSHELTVHWVDSVKELEALEKFYNEEQRITNCSESLLEQYQLFEMNPGDGVYVPVTAPHWGRTLDEISISVSINFRTPSSIRRDRVYRMNRMLRKLRLCLHPVSPQANSWPELKKSSILGGPTTIKNLIRK